MASTHVSLLLSLLLASPLLAEETTYRIRFGLTDERPMDWHGNVSVSGGSVRELRSWRPRAADQIGASTWKLATSQGRKFRWRNWEPEQSQPVSEYVYEVGLWLTIESEGDARVDISTAQGNFSFRTASTRPGEPKHFLDRAVIVERSADYSSVSQTSFEASSAAILADSGSAYWTAWIGYKDWSNRVFARRFDGSSWGRTYELTEGENDVYAVRLAADGEGVVAVWSNRSTDNFDLFARRFDGSSWQPTRQLTTEPGADIHHALTTDSGGRVWLVWQGVRKQRYAVLARHWDGEQWSSEERVSDTAADAWNPAVAADSRGNLYAAWETYEDNDYDIVMRRFASGSWGEIKPLASTARYEAYPSLTCDSEDRLWAAWNESDTRWGKDTGFLVRRPATQLYQSRWMRTAVLAGDQWMEPSAQLERSLPEELQGFNDFPQLAAGPNGEVFLAFRHRFLRQREVPKMAASHRAAWETFVTSFNGADWSTPVPVPVTQGRSDHALSVDTTETSQLIAAWATDNRIYDDYFFEHGELFAGVVPHRSRPTHDVALTPLMRDELAVFPAHPNEAEDVAAIRSYEIRSEGKVYKIYRGDTHRHTEYSGDGNNDGSLNDTYRYAINAASLDYLGVSDHHNSGGPNIEYINWLLQQRVDVFHIPGRFVPLFGYERGESYPNGHRNIFFAERGNPTYPTQPNERETSSGQVGLFDYVRKYGGISIPHTPATGMGTDWRDSAPDVEPLVEIFQGDRVSSEYDGAPFAATEGSVKLQAGGYREKGYLWNAWAKGIKIGLQASSDHLSTHFSFACTIAEEFTREGLIDAMKQRHNYAATDNIVLDYRLRTDGHEFLQGDALESKSGEFELRVNVLGTAPIRQIDVIRGQEFVHTLHNLGKTATFTFKDADPPSGESYYYVRVQQANEQMAWSSPIWIRLP